MATKEKYDFPKLPIDHWWNLRKKFQTTIPGTVTPNYIAAMLSMKEASAKGNVLTHLRIIGLIDKDGKTDLDFAKRWRDDAQYPDLCGEIRDRLYPQELRDLVSGRDPDSKMAKNG